MRTTGCPSRHGTQGTNSGMAFKLFKELSPFNQTLTFSSHPTKRLGAVPFSPYLPQPPIFSLLCSCPSVLTGLLAFGPLSNSLPLVTHLTTALYPRLPLTPGLGSHASLHPWPLRTLRTSTKPFLSSSSCPSSCPYSPPPAISSNSLKSLSQKPNTNTPNFLNLPFAKIFLKTIKVDSNL